MQSNSKLRFSNMELLRIVAMFLVMTDHAGFMALGVPTKELTTTNPILSLLTFSDMSISIICVNTFVLLSGWFGIKWHPRKLVSLIFQVLFFSSLVFIIVCAYEPDKYLNLSCFTTVFLFHSNDYWFIKSYILLFLLAPIINRFIENSQEKDLRLFLISFYAFQTIYAWLNINGAGDFVGGYSVLSFIGLYILARYVKLYWNFFFFKNWNFWHFSFVFIGIAIAQTAIAFGVTKLGLSIAGRLFTYTNPLVIIQALALLLAFAKIKAFHNNVINWISSSCLAVYLLHANELVLRTYYAKFITNLFETHTLTTALFYTTVFIIIAFAISILLDKLRILIWNCIALQKTYL